MKGLGGVCVLLLSKNQRLDGKWYLDSLDNSMLRIMLLDNHETSDGARSTGQVDSPRASTHPSYSQQQHDVGRAGLGFFDKRHLRQPGVVVATVAPATSVSLLSRLKAARPDSSDWNRFEAMYVPLIRRWIGRIPGLSNEVEDLTQEVLLE